MLALAGLLIVAATVAAPMDGAAPHGAVELFRCDFEDAWDATGDQWPDRWIRKREPGFPAYLPVRIEPDPLRPGNHLLRIDLDGGAAALCSPEIPIQPRFSYGLTGIVRTAGLK